ncbi:MAG: dTMP kinase [Bacillota bacterium]|nr:dTMP kinase [Bacillota bacterium]
MNKGLFLSVEGIDGSGKTTTIGALDKRLVDEGYRTLLLREPGGTAIGEDVRRILLDPRHADMDPLCELLLFAAARAQLVAGVIRPALAAGMVVICDRFTDSTLAYQGSGRGLDLDMIRRVNRIATGGLLPQRTLLLDLDPELAACRLVGREGAGPDRIDAESRAFAERVRAGYLALAREESDRIVTIAADQPIPIVVDRMQEILREDLP